MFGTSIFTSTADTGQLDADPDRLVRAVEILPSQKHNLKNPPIHCRAAYPSKWCHLLSVFTNFAYFVLQIGLCPLSIAL
jgi:hypothetical protein